MNLFRVINPGHAKRRGAPRKHLVAFRSSNVSGVSACPAGIVVARGKGLTTKRQHGPIARENSMKLAGKIALVTGGSRGIGRATALAFAAEGADIAFCHLNDDAKADETAGEIRSLGRRALHGSVDVADIGSGRAFAGRAAQEFGPIDILFNNAGMNIRKPFEAYTEEEFDRILSVHLKGMFFMAQAVYPAMVARGQGCIINVASQRGLKGAVNSAPYSAAKAAIMGFTRALAWEATPKGVRVNAIAPGPIVTDLTATMTPEDRQAFIDALPVGRFGRPEEIAATALLLAGPDGGFYVGATLSPNGGDVMY
ncbi:MAG: SDR family NAD(P)-dependent oxidoreductase [Reyranella sp.]|uniref:SDR family NAD(P)-dependent oxidoreductase n=1 Tax=Reyranella sp. TaxID=1929291 RepID=UPI003D0A1119